MPLTRTALRRSVAVLGVTAAAVAVASCSTAQPESEPTGESDANAALRIGLVLEPTSLDIRHTSGAALEQILVDNVYQGLVSRTPDGEITPALATEWQVSEDGLTYTFPLHEGVAFHGGGELTASDVVSSLTQVVEDESFEGHAELADVESVAETDDGTGVDVTLSQPDQNFLFSLSGPAGLVFDEGDETDLKTAANGTGPFALDEWRQGDGITLTRFDDYWGDSAGLSEVDVSYIPDANALVNGLISGELDAVTPVQADLLPQIEGAGDFEIVKGRTTDKYVLGFNNTAAPLDDVRVREALRLAIDHDALVETIGQGVTQYGPIPELDPGYEDLSSVAPFDPERAEELLAEAGASDLSLTLTVPNVYPTSLSNFLVSAFQDVGVELNVDSVEFSAWLNDVYTNGDYELSLVNHVEARDVGSFANPDYYFHYDSDTVQQLYAEAMAATDVEESNVLLAEVARQVSEDHAADWLYTAEQITALAPGVTDFPVDSLNARLPLAGVTYTGP